MRVCVCVCVSLCVCVDPSPDILAGVNVEEQRRAYEAYANARAHPQPREPQKKCALM